MPCARFNFTTRRVERLAARGRTTRRCGRSTRGGRVRSYTFAEVAREAAATAAGLRAAGVARGDVVMTVMGARPEWVFALLGAWRLGAIALPCSEQLRRKDIVLRSSARSPRVGARGRAQRRRAGPPRSSSADLRRA